MNYFKRSLDVFFTLQVSTGRLVKAFTIVVVDGALVRVEPRSMRMKRFLLLSIQGPLSGDMLMWNEAGITKRSERRLRRLIWCAAVSCIVDDAVCHDVRHYSRSASFTPGWDKWRYGARLCNDVRDLMGENSREGAR